MINALVIWMLLMSPAAGDVPAPLPAVLSVPAPRAVPVPVPPVTALAIEGNHALGTADLRRTIGIKLPAPADSTLPAIAADRTLELYRASGFLRAHVETFYRDHRDGEKGRVLAVRVTEGDRARLDSLALDGCRGLPPERVRRELALQPGHVVAEDAIAGDADRILDLYEEEGYPFAEVSPGDFHLTPRGDRLSFGFHVVEGSRVRVRDLDVSGAERTRTLTIEREMRLERDAIYRQSHLDRGRERLLRSGLFSDVGEFELRPSTSGRDVTLALDVVEAPSNSMEGAIGYVPGSSRSTEGYLTGQINLSLGNIAGTGRKAEVHWRRFAPGSASWRLGYLEPWIGGLPVSLGGELSQEVRDSTYTTRGIELKAIMPISFSLDGEIAATREHTTTGARGFGYEETSRRTGLTAGFAYDRRDRATNSRRGGYVRVAGGWAGRNVEQETGGAGGVDSTVTSSQHVNETEGRLELGWYQPAGGAWVLAFEGDYHEIRASEGEVPYYELTFIGGADGPRGYAEDQFAGARAGRLATEYRYHLTPRSRFHVFLDAGYAAWKGGASTHLGYGAGLNLDSRLGLIGVDLGLPLGQGLPDGKLHLRLRQEW